MIERLPQYIARQAALLEKAGIEQAKAEVELILCHLLGIDRLKLYLDGESLVDATVRARFDAIAGKRLTRYPLQYILGESWFYGRRFTVSPAVMIPTPETELLCRTAIDLAGKSGTACPRILDIGTGSGVIAITIAKELPDCRVTTVDISLDALEVARRNATDLGAADKIDFRQSDLFAAISADDRFDLILSNPPYIAENEYNDLPPEVKAVPKAALLAGPDGLNAIRAILKMAPAFLAEGGRVVIEIGCKQFHAVRALVESDKRYRSISMLKDLNGLDRTVVLSCD